MVSCQLCGHEFEPSTAACHSACPLGSQCHLICCPNCGYQVVDESKSRLAQWLARFLPSKGRFPVRATGPQVEALMTLTQAPLEMAMEVCELAAMPPTRLARLTLFGVTPGVQVKLMQRWPAPVVRVGETELALSSEIVERIWVRQPIGADSMQA